MAFRTRRRKPRVVWLPTYGVGAGSDAGGSTPANGVDYELDVNAGDPIIYDATALTWDQPFSSAAASGGGATDLSLSDFVQGSSYRLRRIVGKVWVGVNNPGLDTTYSNIEVGFGFIIGRCDPDGSLQTDFRNVNPLAQDSSTDPWIWRRTWLLNPSTGANAFDNSVPWNGLPNTNIGMPAQDGPHIDQKTARIVGPDERLIAVIAAANGFTTSITPVGQIQVHARLDYRILASMRTNVGNRRNASR